MIPFIVNGKYRIDGNLPYLQEKTNLFNFDRKPPYVELTISPFDRSKFLKAWKDIHRGIGSDLFPLASNKSVYSFPFVINNKYKIYGNLLLLQEKTDLFDFTRLPKYVNLTVRGMTVTTFNRAWKEIHRGDPTPFFPLVRRSCLNQLLSVQPISYAKGSTIIFPAWKGVIPVVVKISQVFGQEWANLDYILGRLMSESPTFVRVLCTGTISGEVRSEWLKKNEIQFLNTPVPSPRQRFDVAIKAEGSMFVVQMTERIMSPYNFDWFSRQKGNPRMYLSLAFQLLWTLRTIHKRAVHRDFTARNIWLQPIKRKYKTIRYRNEVSSALQYYIPLEDTFHYLPKLGDYDEMHTFVTDGNMCQDKSSVSYMLEKLRKACSSCTGMLQDTIDCLSYPCDRTCKYWNPTDDPVFDIFKSNPGGETIDRDKYYSFDIIDLDRHK